jgi:cell division protease FtsH
MSSTLRNILIVAASVVLIGVLAMINIKPAPTMDVGTFVTNVESGKIKEVVVTGSKVEATLQDDSKVTIDKEPGDSISELLKNYGVDPAKARALKTTIKEPSGVGYWTSVILPTFVPFLLVLGIMFFFFRQVQGQNNRAMTFGQSTARETAPGGKDKITFSDVAGAKEAKQELLEIEIESPMDKTKNQD